MTTRLQEDGGLRVGAAEFRRVRAAVRATGVPTRLEELLRPDPARGGRHRQLPVDVFLTALVLTAYYGQKVLLTKVHNLLTQGLARSLRVELGLAGAGRPDLTIRQVRTCSRRSSAGWHTPRVGHPTCRRRTAHTASRHC